MFVTVLNGNRSGQVMDMPPAIARAKLDNQTARVATEEEIVNAGFPVTVTATSADPQVLPEGYRIEKAIETLPGKIEVSHGYDVYGPSSVGRLNEAPYRNMAGARAHAHLHLNAVTQAAEAAVAAAAAEQQAEDLAAAAKIAALAAIVIPEDWRALTPDQIMEIAREIDPAASSKSAALKVIEAELRRRHMA